MLSKVGWTKVLDDENMVLKKKFDLNSYAHPTVSIEKLEWAESVFMNGNSLCIKRANHCQVMADI